MSGPSAEHIDAVARLLEQSSGSDDARAVLDSSDPAVHAAMLDALVRAGVLSPRFGVLSFANRQIVPVDSEGGADHASKRLGGSKMRRLVTKWEPA